MPIKNWMPLLTLVFAACATEPPPEPPLTPEQLVWARECVLRDPGSGPNWMGVCRDRARKLFPTGTD